jgi:cytoskeletal protein CcmA (bactofilin family)
MAMFSTRKPEAATPLSEPAKPSLAPEQSIAPQSGAVLSTEVSIIGSVKFRNQLLIDCELKGNIDSTGMLTIGKHARILGEVRARSVIVQGTVEGNIFATERCELQAGCTLRGNIEAPRFVVDEDAVFFGSAKVGTSK